MPAEKFSFAHLFCTYIALLETACYQFGFNAASGFILLQFFFFGADLIKPFQKTETGTFFLQPGSLLHLYIYFSVLVLY